ncbi:deoxyuridine 5'-triphosphate nucleotidohydrolase-like [Hydra vulgaris]|uniref:Deoxyuridine 5'-triphosphate nucleotidohydrolase n=1 Tax=Hydra vulgaris TaxID=6087 RepID=A0ABM4DHF5_HYDVU
MWIDTEFNTSVALLPYINELFNKALNEKDFKPFEFYYYWFGHCELLNTGVYMDLMEPDLVGHIYSKSGVAFNYGVVMLNSPGIIDADYKDEIKVLLMNHSKEEYIINPGDAVA